MTWLHDQFIYVLVSGVLASGLLVYCGSQFSKRWCYLAAGVTAVLTAVLVLIGLRWETEADRVQRALYDVAAAIERNDLEATLAFIHTRARAVRAQASSEMTRYDFTDVSIKRNLKVVVDEQADPMTAEARFNVVVRGTDEDRLLGSSSVPRYVVVKYELENDQWKIVGYEHSEPTTGMRRPR